jgi:hypothetical protein
MRMVNANSKKDRTAPAVLESTPPALAARSESDWPPLPSLDTKCFFETELGRITLNEGDEPYLALKVRGQIPLNRLSDFEYRLITALEDLFREKSQK